VDVLGVEDAQKLLVPYEVRGDGVIDVPLPVEWRAAPSRETMPDRRGPRARVERVAEAVPGPARPAMARPAPAAANGVAADDEVTLHGITIVTRADEESITYGPDTIEITTNQARVLAVLLRAYPSTVAEEFVGIRALPTIKRPAEVL